MIDYEFERQRKRAKKELRWWLEELEYSETEVLGLTWHSGYDSAQRLDGARRLSQEVGLTHVTFTDTSNVAHELLMADATTVVIAISSEFQAKFAQKQLWAIEIENATNYSELPVLT